MNNSASFAQLIQEVDVALAERRDLRQRGIHLIVTHLDHIPGTLCYPGEMIGDIEIGAFPAPLSLGLSHTSLLLMDCFCRYRMPLVALRIEEIMSSDPFYIRYASNRIGHDEVGSVPDRSSTRIYVWRIRKHLERVFQKAGINADPNHVLASDMTDSNVLAYRLKATVEYVHVDVRKRKG